MSASGIVTRASEVLLVRHTYGPAKGKLLIPGGIVESGEMPEQTIQREVFEETQVRAIAEGLLAFRFRLENWWTIFALRYVSGTPTPDSRETDLAFFLAIQDAIDHPEVTDSSWFLLEKYVSMGEKSLQRCDFKPALHSDEQWIMYSP